MYKMNKVIATVECKIPAVKKEACLKFLNGMYQCEFVQN